MMLLEMLSTQAIQEQTWRLQGMLVARRGAAEFFKEGHDAFGPDAFHVKRAKQKKTEARDLQLVLSLRK